MTNEEQMLLEKARACAKAFRERLREARRKIEREFGPRAAAILDPYIENDQFWLLRRDWENQ